MTRGDRVAHRVAGLSRGPGELARGAPRGRGPERYHRHDMAVGAERFAQADTNGGSPRRHRRGAEEQSPAGQAAPRGRIRAIRRRFAPG